MPEEEVFVTIITYEEQMRGWLTYASRANTPDRQVEAYRRRRRHIERYRRIPLLDYDERAVVEFEQRRKARIRIGTMDLEIAAIAIANNAVLLNRNRSDFGKVPHLNAEDWTL